MRFLRKIEGVTLLTKVRSSASDIQKSLNIEQLLRIEKSQLRWFGHVSRMPQERLSKPNELYLFAKVKGKKFMRLPRTHRNDYCTLKMLDRIAWDFNQAK